MSLCVRVCVCVCVRESALYVREDIQSFILLRDTHSNVMEPLYGALMNEKGQREREREREMSQRSRRIPERKETITIITTTRTLVRQN